MSKALTKAPSADISGYTAQQVDLIKNTIAVGATNDELLLFLQVCKNHKLDPFTRQVHFVKRKVKNADGSWGERGTFQIAIDGFRTIAERTGAYAGNDDPVFDDEAKPRKATVTVWKMVNGIRCPFTATARASEYVPMNAKGELTSPMWRKMPMLMLSKCAEALALRKAFPEALSGLYSDDEMQQVEPREEVKAVEVDPPTGPTKQFVMENVTAQTRDVDLFFIYDRALQYTWTPEERIDIHECFMNRYAIIHSWMRNGDMFFDSTKTMVATAQHDEKTGKVSIVLNEAAATAEEAAAIMQPTAPAEPPAA